MNTNELSLFAKKYSIFQQRQFKNHTTFFQLFNKDPLDFLGADPGCLKLKQVFGFKDDQEFEAFYTAMYAVINGENKEQSPEYQALLTGLNARISVGEFLTSNVHLMKKLSMSYFAFTYIPAVLVTVDLAVFATAFASNAAHLAIAVTLMTIAQDLLILAFASAILAAAVAVTVVSVATLIQYGCHRYKNKSNENSPETQADPDDVLQSALKP